MGFSWHLRNDRLHAEQLRELESPLSATTLQAYDRVGLIVFRERLGSVSGLSIHATAMFMRAPRC